MRLMGAACLAVLAMHGASPQRFRVTVEAVRVDVLVVDGKHTIGGLTAADFELRDSGVIQEIESVAFEEAPLSVMLALDTSASVQGLALTHLKQAASAVVDLLTPADRGALLTFSGALRLSCEWTSDRRALQSAIAHTEAEGATALHDAAYAALTLHDPELGRALVLIFSDGVDTVSWLSGARVVEIARRNEAVVYGVTLSSDGRRRPGYRLDFTSGIQAPIKDAPGATLLQPFLEGLAQDTGGKVMNTERSEQLREMFVQIVKEFRSRYLLTYTPRGVDTAGWHPLEVKLKRRSASVTARRGYLR